MENLSELRKIGDDALDALTRHGEVVVEPIFNTLNGDLKNTLNSVKAFYTGFSERYRKGMVTFGEGLKNFLSIGGVEDLARYLVLAASLFSSLKVVKSDRFYDSLSKVMNEVLSFIKDPSKDNGIKLTKAFVKEYGMVNDNDVNEAVKSYAISLRRIARRGGLAKELAVIRRYGDLENTLRNFMSPYPTVHRNKSVRMLVRWIAHSSGAPLAIKVMVRGENRLYIPIGDMYSAMAVIGTGAFLKMIDDHKARTIYSLLMQEGEVKIPYGLARSITIKVLKASIDPIAAEKGAYDVGYNYISKDQLDKCPLGEQCLRFRSFKIALS